MNESNGLQHDTSTHLSLRQEFLIRQLQKLYFAFVYR